MRSRKTRPSILFIKWGLPSVIFIALVAALLYAVDHSILDAREMFASSSEQTVKDYISKKAGSNRWKIIEWHYIRSAGEFYINPHNIDDSDIVVPVTTEVEHGAFGWVQGVNVYVLRDGQVVGSYNTKSWSLEEPLVFDDDGRAIGYHGTPRKFVKRYNSREWYLQGAPTVTPAPVGP